MTDPRNGGRRRFLRASGLMLGFAGAKAFSRVPTQGLLRDHGEKCTAQEGKPALWQARPLVNPQTAVGLGDQPAGIVDRFGNLDSRNVHVSMHVNSVSQDSSGRRWSQRLEDGYLPIVNTSIVSGPRALSWRTYAATDGFGDADCIEIVRADLPFEIEMRFPFTTQVEVDRGRVVGDGRVLAVFPVGAEFRVSQARYNFLTPERDCYSLLRWPWSTTIFTGSQPGPLPGIDAAFTNGRASFLFRPLRYRFPVLAGKTYHVVLGLMAPEQVPADGPNPAKSEMRLSVDDDCATVNMDELRPGDPFLREFVVQSSSAEILVTSATDPSSTSPYRPALLNGIWIFEESVDLDRVKRGQLNDRALFYVPCGSELAADVACRVTLDYSSSKAEARRCRIELPYREPVRDLNKTPARRAATAARDAVRQHWQALFSTGAEFVTGDPRLDNLYKTSLINIFLLRTRYAGAANGGEDLYVIKPGATLYDAFWYRDASYIIAALGVAGHPAEAEKSLRLFWQAGLPGDFGSFGQQPSGAWQSPLDEIDGQGEALWALTKHFLLSGDRAWLEKVYPNVCRGARWIEDVTDQMRYTTEEGERPIYYGLMPSAEGEAIGTGYNYYHNYWAIFGLRMAVAAAKALHEEGDVGWMTAAHDRLRGDLLASIKFAFESVGQGNYIPATPFQPVSEFDIWGSMAALYPARVLEPHDPMISRTLELMLGHAQEDSYTYFVKNKIWTYITADWAMCHLLRDEIDVFQRLFDGYVAHASATNAWIEEFFIDSRIGTGDMPHGWAAAQYVHLHRNALIFEDDDVLHLCWGAREKWVENGIRVTRAPTHFGSVSFDLRREGPTLVVDYRLTPGVHQMKCRGIRLHIPRCASQFTRARINGVARRLSSGQSTIELPQESA